MLNYQFFDNKSDTIIYLVGNNKNELDSFLDEIKVSLVFIITDNWNGDLTPWPAKVIGQQFDGLADKTIEELLKIINEVENTRSITNRYIAGYSLAGLFALYCLSKSPIFNGAICCSGSLWFPGFVNYMKQTDLHGEKVYLSLGDKEEKTRNTTMAKVGDNTREVCALFSSKGIETTLEMNNGGHFNEPEKRMIKGIKWMIS